MNTCEGKRKESTNASEGKKERKIEERIKNRNKIRTKMSKASTHTQNADDQKKRKTERK